MEKLQRVMRRPKLPARPADAHKGQFGRVLVVGGSDDMLGAPLLAGTAALRSGSGLVYLAVPRTILAAALSVTPELVGVGLEVGKRGMARVLEAAENCDALVVGPGMGRSAEARQRVLALVAVEKPGVVDADGLNVLAAEERWPADFAMRAVLTPHPGEMARLARHFRSGTDGIPADPAGRIEVAVAAARAFSQVIALKGHRTVVTDGRRVYVNGSGDSTLAKGGSGDVLSGMIGSLLGQGMEPFEAAVLGVYLHGRAGQLAGRRFGVRSALARDVIECIGAALREE